MHGTIAFGFWDSATLRAPVLDPTFGKFVLSVKRFSFETGNFEIEKEIELTSISHETHPDFFYEGS